jgi:hypothetical protein
VKPLPIRKYSMELLISLRKCAEKIGVSHSYLSKLKKEGYFSDHDVPGKKRKSFLFSEVESAVIEIRGEVKTEEKVDIFSDSMDTKKYIDNLTSDEKKAHEAAVLASEQKRRDNEKKLAELKAQGVDVSDVEEDMDDMKKGSLLDVKIQTEKYRGLNYKLDYLKKNHKQIDVDEIEAVLFKAGRHLRDILLACPRRNAPALAGKDARTIEKVWEEENINALNEFARVMKDEFMDKII